jgi:phage virion morphogenesis protein
MAGVVLKVDARVVSRKLKKAARNAEHMTAAFREVGEIALRSIRKNFDASGRPTKWPPRTTRYRGKRAKNKLLIDTGRLIDSITYRAHSTHVDIGTNVEYAATHQFGRDAIPARPFIMLQDEDSAPIREAILAHIKGDFD